MNSFPSLPARPDWPRRGLYAITPEHSSDARLLADAAAVLSGGAVMLQYRSKRDSASRRHARAVALLALCRAHDALFIVNDDVALADAIGADGVHLGASDTGVAQARARLGRRAIIGASCYADLQRARRACAAGASYVAFGAFFPSPTKPQAAPAAADLLRESAALGVPRVAIGGIQLENAPLLVDAGADLLAVVSDVFGAADPGARSAAYARLFAATPDPRCTRLAAPRPQETP